MLTPDDPEFKRSRSETECVTSLSGEAHIYEIPFPTLERKERRRLRAHSLEDIASASNLESTTPAPEASEDDDGLAEALAQCSANLDDAIARLGLDNGEELGVYDDDPIYEVPFGQQRSSIDQLYAAPPEMDGWDCETPGEIIFLGETRGSGSCDCLDAWGGKTTPLAAPFSTEEGARAGRSRSSSASSVHSLQSPLAELHGASSRQPPQSHYSASPAESYGTQLHTSPHRASPRSAPRSGPMSPAYRSHSSSSVLNGLGSRSSPHSGSPPRSGFSRRITAPLASSRPVPDRPSSRGPTSHRAVTPSDLSFSRQRSASPSKRSPAMHSPAMRSPAMRSPAMRSPVLSPRQRHPMESPTPLQQRTKSFDSDLIHGDSDGPRSPIFKTSPGVPSRQMVWGRHPSGSPVCHGRDSRRSAPALPHTARERSVSYHEVFVPSSPSLSDYPRQRSISDARIRDLQPSVRRRSGMDAGRHASTKSPMVSGHSQPRRVAGSEELDEVVYC